MQFLIGRVFVAGSLDSRQSPLPQCHIADYNIVSIRTVMHVRKYVYMCSTAFERGRIITDV